MNWRVRVLWVIWLLIIGGLAYELGSEIVAYWKGL